MDGFLAIVDAMQGIEATVFMLPLNYYIVLRIAIAGIVSIGDTVLANTSVMVAIAIANMDLLAIDPLVRVSLRIVAPF